MTSLPRVLYRTVSSEEAGRNHLLGILWFRSLKHFRTVEGAGRDELEGIGSYTVGAAHYVDVADERPVFPAFILSFSEQPIWEHGDFALKLLDPCALRERVKERLFQDPAKADVEWHKVTYDKTRHLEAELGPSEEWGRKHYSKPVCFACEREWRLVIFLPPPLRILNDTLKVGLGNLQGIFRYCFRKNRDPASRRPVD